MIIIKKPIVPVEVPHLAMKKPPSLGVIFLGRDCLNHPKLKRRALSYSSWACRRFV